MQGLEAEIVVLGGGAIGAATAYYLSKAGKDVILLESGELATGASGANEAFVWTSTRKPGIPLRMALASAELFKELQSELDLDIEYKQTGGLIVIETERQLEMLKPWIEARREAGLEKMELLDAESLGSREPYLSRRLLGATFNPWDGCVNPIYLVLGLIDKAKAFGARVFEYTTVNQIIVKDGQIQSVVTDQGEIKTKYVVNACGAWSPNIGRLVGINLPITPNRMQLLVSEPIAPFIDRVIMCACYISGEDAKNEYMDSEQHSEVGLVYSQTKKGNLLLGSTTEFVGYDKQTTYQAMRAICHHVKELIPVLAERKINIIRSFANFFPYTADDLPIMGKVPGLEGFIMAAGHNGHGICLGPISGKLISELIVHGETSIPIDQLSLTRFLQ